ncbi:MAG: GNAT family N-acetyltransferase [Pseudomonadota bacterium]
MALQTEMADLVDGRGAIYLKMMSETPADPAPITIRSTRQPGDLGLIVWLHGVGYADGVGAHDAPGFEAYVAQTVADFGKQPDARGTLFFAERQGPGGSVETVGCAAMIERHGGPQPRGQIRWVITLDTARGQGVGGRLIDACMDEAQQLGFHDVYLQTTSGLDASMAIYQQLGFQVIHHEQQELWNGQYQDLIEMLLVLDSNAG